VKFSARKELTLISKPFKQKSTGILNFNSEHFTSFPVCLFMHATIPPASTHIGFGIRCVSLLHTDG